MKTFKGSPQYLRMGEGTIKPGLDYLVLQLDSVCPHACRYCFAEREPGWQPKGDGLSLDERKGIVNEARALGARVVSMPGDGEPLAVKGTRDLIAHIHKNRMISIVYTKGYLLTREWTHFLADHDATVVLSIDSLHERTAMKLNPKPCGWFPTAMENIEYAKSVFGRVIETVDGRRITRLLVNHMVNLLNLGEQERMKDWCDDDILFVCHAPSREGGAVRIWDKLAGGLEEHESLITYANGVSETEGNTTARADGKCAYYLNGITVGANGDVKLCPASAQTAGFLGNVRTASLEKLRTAAREALERILGGDAPPCLVRAQSYDKIVSELASL